MKSCSQKRLIKAHNSGVSCVAGVRQEFLPWTALRILQGLTPQEGAELELSFWKGALIKPPPSACMAQTQPTPGKPCSSPVVTCRDSRRATCGWHRSPCMTAVADGVPPAPCQPSKERCPQLEPVVASSRGFPTCWKHGWWASWANSRAPLLSQPPSSSATHVRRLFQWEGFHLFMYWRGARDDEGHGNEQERAQQYLRTQAGTHTQAFSVQRRARGDHQP